MALVARLLAVTALAVGLLGAAPSGPAQAHTALVTSSPAAGSVVGTPPTIVTLRLSQPARGATVRLTDGCGAPVPATVVVAGTRVSIRLDQRHEHGQHPARASDGGRVGAGWWRVDWRVVAADAHSSSGNVAFLVDGAAQCGQADRSTPTANSAVEGDGANGAGANGAGVSSGDRFPLRPVAGITAVTVVLVGGRLLRRRRGR